MVTKRQRDIVFHLISEDEPVLIRDLAASFSVTPRTIKTDIKEIKSWLRGQPLTLESQPNKGIWFEGKNEKVILHIHQQLLLASIQEDKWQLEGRIIRIILILILHPTQYVTGDMLANFLSVSKKTIYLDMKKVDHYLDNQDVYLQTTARKGYSIAGNEIDIRHFAEKLITQKLSDENMLNGREKLHFLTYLSALSNELMRIVENVNNLMEALGKQVHAYTPSHSEWMTLYVRLSITVCRHGKGYPLYDKQNRPLGNVNQLLSGFTSYAHLMMKEVFQKWKMPQSHEEFVYIYRGSLNDKQNDDIVELTNTIIDFVSEKMQLPFYQDSVLQMNLMAHLSNQMTEENMLLMTQNPFMDDIKNNHQTLYEAVQEGCQKYMLSSYNVSMDIISSFIALHFLVSLESHFLENTPLKALYVCATGRGVARIIKNRVEREVPQLKVVQYCGLDDVESVTEGQDFDIVISVFPIDIQLPTVWVEAVPTEKNIEEVKSLVKELTGNDAGSYLSTPFVQNVVQTEDAESVSRDIILQSMEIYHALKEAFGHIIKSEFEEAFLIHVFLMVHRVKFSKEYDHLVNQAITVTENYKVIDNIFKAHQLDASVEEKEAILFYLEREQMK